MSDFIKPSSVKPACPYKAFYDRRDDNVNGLFTIIDTRTNHKLFDRLPARSGQRGYTFWRPSNPLNWLKGKAPIPKGIHRIKLDTPLQPNTFPTSGGIGEFWGVYNTPQRSNLILSNYVKGEKPGYRREDIGIHPENIYVGSAGCVVLLWDSPERKNNLIRLSNFMKSIIGLYKDDMPFEVL